MCDMCRVHKISHIIIGEILRRETQTLFSIILNCGMILCRVCKITLTYVREFVCKVTPIKISMYRGKTNI